MLSLALMWDNSSYNDTCIKYVQLGPHLKCFKHLDLLSDIFKACFYM